MWDNPRLLNAAANALIALAVLIFAYAGLQLLLRSPLFPLREVVVVGEPTNASREEIAAALEGVGGNFFAAELAEVRGRLEQVPWVRRVDARRVWPDRIEVRLEEHVAFARWAAGGLVNSHGEPFAAVMDAAEQKLLPLLEGPPGSEQELVRRYRRFAELLTPLGAIAEQVVLTPRHAWQLRLGEGAYEGLTLELGRDRAEAVEARLSRFIAVAPDALSHMAMQNRHVDLRYPNGFAMRVAGWKG